MPGDDPRIALVACKHVPIGGGFLKPDADGHGLTREGLPQGLDPLNEVALEWAVRGREAGRLDAVVAVTMGPPEAVEALRRAIALGADDAVLISDERLRGSDVRVTARVIAAAARRLSASLVVMGYESLDASSGVVPSAVAALLDRPLLSRCRDADLTGSTVRAQCDLGDGPVSLEADIPAVLSFVEGAITPRFPKLKQVLSAKSRAVTQLSLTELEISLPTSGERVIGLRAVETAPRQTRVVGLMDGVEELLRLLVPTNG